MASGRGLTIELSAEQVRTIVERAAGYTAPGVALDLALLVPSLRRVLAGGARDDISYAFLRGLLVLATFPVDGSPRRLTEIATELDMKTSTVHRFLNTLVVVGALEQDDETRRYSRPRAGFPPDGPDSR
ncbi:MAG TPA: helix-turn-helix domain-containing protein [Solirubrobacteraceae bacterium]|nr:helix-turn-helix domain-containing protein [Solirubrobacteraceae bacterium]